MLNHLELLDTLLRRERIAGLAEAVKVALIRDRDFFESIAANADRLVASEGAAEEHMIRRCAARQRL